MNAATRTVRPRTEAFGHDSALVGAACLQKRLTAISGLHARHTCDVKESPLRGTKNEARPGMISTSSIAVARSSAPRRSTPSTQHRLYQLLDGFKTATLIVRGGKHLTTRRVSVLRVDEGSSVWLALDLDQCPQSLDLSGVVQLVCQSPNVHLTVSGEAKVVPDASPSDLTVITLEPSAGEYWEALAASRATLWRRSEARTHF
jgi:hypothetical protein